MDDQPRQSISDPVRIRALGHPLRIELLDMLIDGPATATECAQVTGESVASCSFHLRTLAKYGYIEPDTRRGREKPWKLASRGQDIRPDDSDPASVHAVAEIATMYLERASANTRQWLSQLHLESDEWVQASTLTGASFWLTAEELAEFSRTLQNLATPYRGRNEDPSLRPEGARAVSLFATAHVDTTREQRKPRSGS